MPANRSRTTHWRRLLQQLIERGGSIEITVSQANPASTSKHLLWRVRLFELKQNELIVEQPTTLGRRAEMHPEVELLCIFSVGQNRWKFNSYAIGTRLYDADRTRTVQALRLQAPEEVHRCRRRQFERLNTAGLELPAVEIWPLLNPSSAVIAERASELHFERTLSSNSCSDAMNDSDHGSKPAEGLMPELGPGFSADLLNIGGGGLGIQVPPDHAAAFSRHRLFWVRFSLGPEMPCPICATAKVTHTHVDSTQHTYAGMAFDFTFNPRHQQFVADQICAFTAAQQQKHLQSASSDA